MKNRLLPAARCACGIQRETILVPAGSTQDCAAPVSTRIPMKNPSALAAVTRARNGTEAVARVRHDQPSSAAASTGRGPQRSTARPTGIWQAP